MNTRIQFQISAILPELKELKKAGEQEEFNERLIAFLPEVKQYIAHAINVAEKDGQLSKNTVKTEEILDELYITSYRHLDELDDPELFNSWIILQAERAMQDAMIAQEFNSLFFTGLDKYTDKEWDEMEEKYSVDAGGDLVLMEEFDDPSYGEHDFTLDKVFMDDADKAIIEKVDKDLSDEAVKKHFLMMMDKMSLPMRTSLRLSVFHKRTPEQISALRHTAIQEVNEEIAEAKRLMLTSFKGRFLS